MIIFSCYCLNVHVFGENLTFPESLLENCPLGTYTLPIEFVQSGFTYKHKCLAQRQRVKEWTVYTCVMCRMKTHAINHEKHVAVVSTRLLKGEAVIDRLKKRPDYSIVYGIVLCPDEQSREEDVEMQPYMNLQPQLTELQKILTAHLKYEEDAMEKRIRNYEMEERSKFQDLQAQAQEEKTKLTSTLFNSCESSKSLMKEKTPRKFHAPLSQSKSVNEDVRKSIQESASPDELFDLEDLIINDENENFDTPPVKRTWARLDNESSRSRSRGRDGSSERTEAPASPSLMSTSVPISMPQMSRNRKPSFVEDIEESAEFADIPKNMQALSESIQEKDRYIFGDRPRQRVNTGDFTQVNWR